MSVTEENSLLKEYKIIQDTFDNIKNEILYKHQLQLAKKTDLIDDLFSIFDFQILFINQISQTYRGISDDVQCKEKIIFNLIQINRDMCIKRINSFIEKHINIKASADSSFMLASSNVTSNAKSKIKNRNTTPNSNTQNTNSHRFGNNRFTRNRDNNGNLNLKNTLTNEDIIEKIKSKVERKNQHKVKTNSISNNSINESHTVNGSKIKSHINKSNSTAALNKQQIHSQIINNITKINTHINHSMLTRNNHSNNNNNNSTYSNSNNLLLGSNTVCVSTNVINNNSNNNSNVNESFIHTANSTKNNRIYKKPQQLNNLNNIVNSRSLTPNNKNNKRNDAANITNMSILSEMNNNNINGGSNNKRNERTNSCHAVIGTNSNVPGYSFEEKLLNKYHQILDNYNSHKTQEQYEKETKQKYNESNQSKKKLNKSKMEPIKNEYGKIS